MALTAKDFIRPVRMLDGTPIPLLEVTKESATTWVRGAIIIATSGYAVEASDGPTTGTILGVAAEDAISGNLTALIHPALPQLVFTGRIATGDTGGTVNLAATNRYIRYGLSLDSTTTWYVNVADTTDLAALVLDLVDPIGTAWGRVNFTFCDSKFNAI